MEKNCVWYFKEEGGRDVGPNDPVHEKFKQDPYSSIVRESIQNSLDAVKDEEKPVNIEFAFFTLSRNDFPNLFDITTHIRQCSDYYINNTDATGLFKDMNEFLEIEKSDMTCLRISDYNTKGMTYEPKNRNSPFYAFLRSGGVSAKNQGSGGSFGFGKGAYYALSPIKTIIVSTKDEKEQVFFEGSTILTTHMDDSDKILTAYGYYDNENGNPTQIEDSIPSIFRRESTGTDISIIGLWEDISRKNSMIKSVLSNFWYAIFDNKLTVKIEDITINKNNLERIIDDFFNNSQNELELSPMPYLKAVKYSNRNDDYKYFEETLETLGEVRLYVYLDKDLPNRISYFRKPKMLVYQKRETRITGFAAVFICDNDMGNNILRKMENPAHNEWKKENFRNHGEIDKKAIKAEQELRGFIKKSLETLSGVKKGKKLAVLELEEYLSIPEELIDNKDEIDAGGNNMNNTSGINSKDITSTETGSQTTHPADNKPTVIKPTVKNQSKVKDNKNASFSSSGAEKMSSGGNNNGDGGSRNNGNKHHQSGTEEKNDTPKKVLVDAKLRVAAQKENNELFHYLIVTPDKPVAEAEIELLVGGDNGMNEAIDIISSNKGIISNNVIKKVQLVRGKNEIKIQFNDNLKHSVIIRTYEV